MALLGAAGMLGADLAAGAPSDVELHAFGREVDLRDGAAVSAAIDAARPALIINAAAYTRVDLAERDESAAFEVNAVAVGLLAALCGDRGIPLVHYSTDYVFDGRARSLYSESDRPRPVNVYGASKLAGELAVASTSAEALVLRTQWLFGRYGRCFPATMLGRARSGLPTRVVDDQFGRPTSTADLALATWRLVKSGERGLFHVTNSGPVASWFDVAREVFAAVGVPALVQPCGSEEYPTPAARPAFSALDCSAVEARLGAPLPDWRASLALYVDAMKDSPPAHPRRPADGVATE